MKKTILTLVGALVISLVAIQGVFAETFAITADIPSATVVEFITSRVENGGEFTVIGTGNTPLNFTTAGEGIIFDAVNGIWAASRFFAIDVSPQTAAGDPAPASYNQIDLSYVDGLNPNGGADGLGAKGVVTVVRVDTVEDPNDANALIQVETEIVADSLNDIGSANVTNGDVAGGFMRAYVGISTGEPGKPGVPFTNGDAPGTYTGTLTFTATLN